jgi:glycosyltransferase involved in cell wall biosynthesis
VREVLFMQSKFPTSNLGLEALLGRWETYACKLEEAYGITSICVVAPFKKIEDSAKYPHLRFLCKSKSPLKNISSLFRLIESTERSFMLICGDNLISLFVSSYSRRFFGDKVSIQCQFHGDVYTSLSNPGLRGIARVASSRYAFSQADSIRIVSQFQEIEIRRISPNVKAKFIVSPIPIDYSKIPKQRATEMNYDVAVVGRLHAERGIDQAILIIKEILNLANKTRVVFVGEGNYSDSIHQELAKEIESGSVELLGALSGERLRDIYASSKVLLSTAPREGYGLTLREACLSGMVVVASNSEGAREAGSNFLTGFELFDSVQEAAIKVLRSVEGFSENTNRAELIQIQKDKDDENLKRLLESWVRP